MYAECPHCHAIFRVTPNILRVAHGKVRCGECETVFDTGIDPDELEQPDKENNVPAQGDLISETLDENLSPDSTQVLETSPSLGITDLKTLGEDEEDHPQPSLFSTEEELQPDSGKAGTNNPGETRENTPPKDNTKTKTAKPPRKRRNPLRPLAAPFALMLVLLLFAQYLYKNRVELSQYSSLRPLLTTLCEVAKCELPPQVDTQQIALLNHGVYSHPNIDNALMIKATIVNQAPFVQPLPIIELSLSNIRGKKLALRRFLPSEYLADDKLPDDELMPIGEKIPVSIQVKDPGKEALAFEFEFLER